MASLSVRLQPESADEREEDTNDARKIVLARSITFVASRRPATANGPTMRLLHRDDDGMFVITEDLAPNNVPPYAILSHTWGSEEVVFADLLRAPSDWQQKVGFNKIKFCAEQARRDGLRYFWVDTCCIDKSNAVELQTAINSMFRWYRDSTRCYVYLADVSVSGSDIQPSQTQWEDVFRNSRWFTRGWTLQELVAPKTVDFYTTEGTWLGNKQSLEPTIRDVTGIPATALRGTPLSEFTISEREAWVRNRRTTYEEDMVYALLGIFGVYMLPNYGEGLGNAQKRLREEVQKVVKGSGVKDFSVTFSLSATSETQHFVSRESEIAEMRRNLSSDGSRRVVVLHGLGGIGKTQLAVAYAKRYRDEYSGVFWLNVKDEASIRQSFASVARQILQQHPDAAHLSTLDLQQNHEGVVEAVKAWLSLPGNTRWLIVYDNYDNPKLPGRTNETGIDIDRLLPMAYQGSIVITTRVSQIDVGHGIRVKKLESADSCLEILSRTSGRDGLRNDTDAISLVSKLDGLPLALATAGAYLKRTSISLSDCLRLYEKSWVRLHTSAPALGSYQDRTLCSTWQLSYDQVQVQSPLAAHLLRWWAYFDNEDIWFELLHCRRRREDDPLWISNLSDELNFNSAMSTLSDYGFIEPFALPSDTTRSRGYSIHSCLHSWTVHVLNKEKDDYLAKLAVECVASCVPAKDCREFWLLRRRLFPHALKSIATIQGHHYLDFVASLSSPDSGARGQSALHRLGVLYHDHGKHAKAEEMYIRALQGYEEAWGPGHKWIFSTVESLAMLYSTQERYAEAKEMYLRALRGKKTAWGPDHPSTLSTLRRLATLHNREGSYKEAEKIFNRTLGMMERVLGPDHPKTLATIRGLGEVYENQGKYTKAEKTLIRAFRGYEKTHGPEHIYTLHTVEGLGALYRKQRKYLDAEKMDFRALHGYIKAWGPDHPSTLGMMGTLADVYLDQGKYDQAEEMLIIELQGHERVVGSQNIGKHRPAINTTRQMGDLARSRGQLGEARTYYQHAYHDLRDLLGPSHGRVIALQSTLLDLEARITGQPLVAADVAVPTPIESQKGKRRNTLRRLLGIRERRIQ